MQFAIGVTILKCSLVKHSHNPLEVKKYLLLSIGQAINLMM
jgi:hypothetical protein